MRRRGAGEKAAAQRPPTVTHPLLIAADLLDPPSVTVDDLLAALPDLQPPSPRQEAFLDATDWDVFYGGAMGGGKTIALLMIAFVACLSHPGIEVWYFRKTIPQLRGSAISDLRDFFAMGKPFGCRWNDTFRELRYPNGARLRFLHAEAENDATDYYSQSCQLLIIDERTLMLPSIVDNLQLRVRSGNPSIPVIGIRSASNPGNHGHGVVKKRYIDAGPPDRPIPIPKNRHGRCRRFIPAKLSDNRHLPEEYAGSFEEIDDPILRQAMLDGNWDVFAGMAFPEWDRDRYVVNPEQVPVGVTAGISKGLGIDYGVAAPFCALWGAKLADDLVVVYRELYTAGLTPAEQAAAILEAEAPGERAHGRTVPAWLDPSCWTQYPDQPRKPHLAPSKSIASDYTAHGVPVTRAHNDRLGGKRLIHHHLRFQGDGLPRLLIYSTCTHLIAQLGDLPRDPHDPEDVDTKAEDHAYDALRYLLYGLVGKKNREGGNRNGLERPVTAGLMRQGF